MSTYYPWAKHTATYRYYYFPKMHKLAYKLFGKSAIKGFLHTK